MRPEIGGYLELEKCPCSSIHPGAIALDCGRNCLKYLIEARGITSIWLPDLLCGTVAQACRQEGICVHIYHIGADFEPLWDLELTGQDHLYLVDHYGQLDSACVEKAKELSGGRLIIDETEALFRDPWPGIDTIYSVRKFFGVPDGAYLVTDAHLSRALPQSESFDHMSHVLGRFERTASEFFADSRANNERFAHGPLAAMSKLTKQLISSIDIERAKARRAANYNYLFEELEKYNTLHLKQAPLSLAYPLYVSDGPAARAALAQRGIYIPTLWSEVLSDGHAGPIASDHARNILPLPTDQRYTICEMDRMLDALRDEGIIPRRFEGKSLAVLGGTQISCEIVKAAKCLGVHTTVIDYNAPEMSPAKQIADEQALISVADTDEAARYIKEHHIDGVLTGYTDSILTYYAEICEKAGRPCYGTKEQFGIFTDKIVWKKLCREYGVPVAQEFDAAILDLDGSELPFPLMVKPADASGSRGVAVVHTKDELLAAYTTAAAFAKNGKVLIEEYLEGPEATVFWLFINGAYEVFLMGDRIVKHDQEGAIALPVGYTFPAADLPSYLQDVAPQVEAMLKSQGIQNGMMFMQCIIKDGAAVVYDIGYRLTGSLEHYLAQALAGYSPLDMLISYALTGCMTDDDRIWEKIENGRNKLAFNISFLMRPGTIDHFEGLEDIESMPDVIAWIKAHVEGETLPPEAKGELRQIALRVLGIADGIEDLEDTVLDIQQQVRIISTDGYDLKLPGITHGDLKVDDHR